MSCRVARGAVGLNPRQHLCISLLKLSQLLHFKIELSGWSLLPEVGTSSQASWIGFQKSICCQNYTRRCVGVEQAPHFISLSFLKKWTFFFFFKVKYCKQGQKKTFREIQCLLNMNCGSSCRKCIANMKCWVLIS